MTVYERVFPLALEAASIRDFTARELAPVGKRAGDAVLLEPAADLWPHALLTARVLQWLRDTVDRPVVVNSGYRSPKYNRLIGGAPLSMHLQFNAFDIVVPGLDPWLVARRLLEHEWAADLGVGLYQRKRFVHVDTRGKLGHAPWRGSETGERWW